MKKLLALFILAIFPIISFVGCNIESPVSAKQDTTHYDTIFAPDSVSDTAMIYFRISFFIKGSPGCLVYDDGKYIHFTAYGYTTKFDVINGSMMKVKYVFDTNKNDTIIKQCIARDSCVWRVE